MELFRQYRKTSVIDKKQKLYQNRLSNQWNIRAISPTERIFKHSYSRMHFFATLSMQIHSDSSTISTNSVGIRRIPAGFCWVDRVVPWHH